MISLRNIEIYHFVTNPGLPSKGYFMFLSSADLFVVVFSKSSFRKNSFRNTIRISNSLKPDKIWVQTVCQY